MKEKKSHMSQQVRYVSPLRGLEPQVTYIRCLSFLIYTYKLHVVQCYNSLLLGHMRKLCREKNVINVGN